jgi:hypothetical protein
MATVGRPPKKKTKVLFIRLSEETDKAVRAKAKREYRSVSSTVEMILEAHLFTAVAHQ